MAEVTHDKYLSYSEYMALGGALPHAAYLPLEFKSRKRIDRITDSRVANMADVPESVKLCMYALVSMEAAVGAQALATAPTATSFSTDGYSESYGNAMDADTAARQINSVVKEYLYGELDDNGVPLLYRGSEVC